MKIQFEKYNPVWKQNFEKIEHELTELIGFLNPEIEHIGSTSIEGLSAKPIIDILIGVKKQEDLEEVIRPLTGSDYVYYEKYNEDMPYRRFFVKHTVSPKSLSLLVVLKKQEDIPSDTNEHNHRLAHIHILPYEGEHWIRHVAFRDYLRTHLAVKAQYQQLKEMLSERNWADGNEYNAAKDPFIKAEEQKAVRWYLENRK